MIWAYRPYKNPVARKKYLRTVYIMYGIGAVLVGYRYYQFGLTDKFTVPSLALLATITFFSVMILRKPRFCYTDVNHIYTGGKKIRKDEVEFRPDFQNLTVELRGSVNRHLYFEKKEDLDRFLKDVGQDRVKFSR